MAVARRSRRIAGAPTRRSAGSDWLAPGGTELVGREGSGEEVPLTEVTLERPQDLDLRLALDAFGDDLHIEALPEADDQLDELDRSRIAFQVVDERLRDLELVDRELAQCRERRIAG